MSLSLTLKMEREKLIRWIANRYDGSSRNKEVVAR